MSVFRRATRGKWYGLDNRSVIGSQPSEGDSLASHTPAEVAELQPLGTKAGPDI